ncbi:MAG: hypothetical protein JWQ02_3392 [Capsulimonas sp.]|nr:hypothetical protein [Capsulimonas sp.]
MGNQVGLLKFLVSDSGKILVGFVLTTVLGSLITYFVQRISWQRQSRLELFRQRTKDGTDLLERLSSMIDRRAYRLQRLLWAIEENRNYKTIAEREREYYEVVIEWNENLRSMHNGIRLLIGEDEAVSFLEYEDDFRESPQSLHYMFVVAHRAVLYAKKNPDAVFKARQAVDEVFWKLADFLYDATTVFTKRSSSLHLLDFSLAIAPDAKKRQTAKRRSTLPSERLSVAKLHEFENKSPLHTPKPQTD